MSIGSFRIDIVADTMTVDPASLEAVEGCAFFGKLNEKFGKELVATVFSEIEKSAISAKVAKEGYKDFMARVTSSFEGVDDYEPLSGADQVYFVHLCLIKENEKRIKEKMEKRKTHSS
jgi:hypothetical protein